MAALYFVLFVVVSAMVWSCAVAIDKDQEHHERTPAERTAVVATWTEQFPSAAHGPSFRAEPAHSYAAFFTRLPSGE